MNKKKLALIGARKDGQAGVVLDVLSYFNDYEVIAFYDSTPELKFTKVHGITVRGNIAEINKSELTEIDFFHICIGDNKARLEIFNSLKEKGAQFITITHPSATVSRASVISEGCFIGAKSVIQNGCHISEVCIMNTASIIEHDNFIGKAAQLAPNCTTGGRARIEDMAFIGIGSTILPDITIGKSAFIAAGTTISKDVPENTTMIGYSAKVHNKNIYQDIKEQEKVNNKNEEQSL